MEVLQFCGVHTALITPLKEQAVAYDDLEKLVSKQIEDGIDGLVAVGTTGESPTLTHAEHHDVIEAIAKTAAGRVPVLAGTGSNSTNEAISLTKNADATEGVSGMLQVAPYYNKPSQEGLFRHFSAIAEHTRKPIILYSIPGRCGIEISVDTCARLYEAHPHVCGVKEAGGSPEKVSQLRQKLGEDYVILSGDDSMTLPFISCGAQGVVSVASNLLVKDLCRMVEAAMRDERQIAQALHHKYFDFFKTIFIEPNPVPMKYVLHKLGIIQSPEVRLPLCEMTDASKAKLDAVLARLDIF